MAKMLDTFKNDPLCHMLVGILETRLPLYLHDDAIVNQIAAFAGLRGNLAPVRQALTWQDGPWVEPRDLGEVLPGATRSAKVPEQGSHHILVNRELLRRLPYVPDRAAALFFLEIKLLHEIVHWCETQVPGWEHFGGTEQGKRFEHACFPNVAAQDAAAIFPPPGRAVPTERVAAAPERENPMPDAALGIDATFDLSAIATQLRAAGVSTVGRYYARDANAWKRMGPAEAAALSRAGLHIVAVYQDANNKPASFSHALGLQQGEIAYRYARDTIGQPYGSAIYVGVDFHASRQDIEGVIADHFEAIAESWSRLAPERERYRLGVYGSAKVAEHLLERGLADAVWLSGATSWDEGSAMRSGDSWNLRQYAEQPLAAVVGAAAAGAFGARIVDRNDVNLARDNLGAFTLAVDAGPAVITAGQGSLRVTARRGLIVRGGPGQQFAAVGGLAADQVVGELGRSGDWVSIDIEGDGRSDGYCHAGFLEPI